METIAEICDEYLNDIINGSPEGQKQAFLDWDEPGVLSYINSILPKCFGAERKLLLEKVAAYGEKAALCVPTLLGMYKATFSGRKRKLILAALVAIGLPIKEPLLDEIADPVNKKQCLLAFVQLLSTLPSGSLGEELCPLVELTCDRRLPRITIRLLEQLGRHQASAAAPHLLASALKITAKRNMHRMEFEVFRACLMALTCLGEEALALVTEARELLMGRSTRGEKAVILHVMAALGKDGRFDSLIRDYLKAPEKLSDGGLVMILGGIKKAADTRFFDVLHKLLYDIPLEWVIACADAFATCLARGVPPTELLAWVRQLLDEGPSERLWFLLAYLVNTVSEAQQDILIPYLKEHLATWPLHICRASLEKSIHWNATFSSFSSPFWLKKKHDLVLRPAWKLVRSFVLNAKDEHFLQAFVFRLLHSPEGGALEQVIIEGALLEKEGRFESLTRAELPSLKRLNLMRCSMPVHWTTIKEARWIGRLERLLFYNSRIASHLFSFREESLPVIREVMAPDATLRWERNGTIIEG